MSVFHIVSNKLLGAYLCKNLMPNKPLARCLNPSLEENPLLPLPQPHRLVYSLTQDSTCVYQWQAKRKKKQMWPRHHGDFR